MQGEGAEIMGKSGNPLPRNIDLTPKGYRVRLVWRGRQIYCGHYETLELAKMAKRKYQGQIVTETFEVPALVKKRYRDEIAQEKAQSLTVKEWSERWLTGLTEGPNPRSPSTTSSYSSTLNKHVLPALGDKPLHKVTRADVEFCIAEASKGGKTAAGRNVARTVRTMMYAAVAQGAGGLKENPASGLSISTSTRRRGDDELPTLEELNKITSLMPEDTRLAVPLAAWCSMRVAEVIGLQRQDFTNLDVEGAAMLNIQRQWLSKATPPAYGDPKDSSFRKIAVPSALVPQIQKHLNDYVGEDPTSPVFPSPVDPSRPISHNALMARWNKARAKIRPDVTFHSLRHFGLTVYAQQGATQTEIMRRGGHKDADAAARYQHSSVSRDQELTAKLNETIGSAQ